MARHPAGRISTADQAPLRRRLFVLILARAFFILLVSLFLVLFQSNQVLAFSSPAIRLLLGALAGTLLATAVYLVLWSRIRRGLYWLAFAQIQVDLVLWGILILVTGGVNSYFTFLYHVSIVVSAVYLGDRGVIFTLVLSVCSYVIVVLSGLLEWFPGLGSVMAVNAQSDVGDLVVALTLDVGSMVIVAMLGWVLALQVTRTGESLERTQEIFEDLHSLNQAVVELLPSGLITTDVRGRIRTVNPAAREILGRSGRDLMGESLSGIFGEDFPEAAGEPATGEAMFRGEGREMLLEYAFSPLLDGSGGTIGSIVHLMDVTEQRRMREKLGEFEKHRALGDLAVGLAHEIRNPLGSISGSIELVMEGDELKPEDRKLLGIVHRETEKIGRLVTSMFNLARPPDPVIEPTAVAPLIRDVVALFGRDPENRSIPVLLDLDEDLEAMADRDQLEQVVMNLLRNAAQANRDSKEAVQVEAHLREERWAQIRVLDSGPGVDPAHLDHVFDPYFTTKSYGIGVGLALCREIVQRHGGSIHIDNRPRRGAVATVRLPAAALAPIFDPVDPTRVG